jgi:hypothetical protein
MAMETFTKKRTRSIRKTREAEIVKEYEHFVDTATTDGLLTAQTDDDLFVVDRGGSKNKKRKIQKAQIQQRDSGTTSKTEKILINRIKNSQKEAKPVKKEESVFDMWGGEDVVSRPRATTRKQFKKIAGPGMSYNPGHDDHQEALAEVLVAILAILNDLCMYLLT